MSILVPDSASISRAPEMYVPGAITHVLPLPRNQIFSDSIRTPVEISIRFPEAAGKSQEFPVPTILILGRFFLRRSKRLRFLGATCHWIWLRSQVFCFMNGCEPPGGPIF